MIKRFTIKNFKRFQAETVLDLDHVTVLLGANNSGKSTLLQALNLFQYCIETTRERENGNGSKNGKKNGATVLKNRSISPEEFGVLPIAEPADLWPQGKVKANKPITLSAEYESGAVISFELGISYNRFSIRPKTEGDFGEELKAGAIRLVPIFSGFLPQEEYLTPPARIDRMRMQRHGDAVRNTLWDLREKSPAQWKKLCDALAHLFPDSAVAIDFDVEVDRFIRATYHDDVLTQNRDIIAAGSGFHQALQILASVLSPGARIVLLDEPDAHLHARMQGKLMREFDALARDETLQFVIATHSPQILNAAPQGALRICLGGKVVRFGLDPEQLRVLDAVGATERMEIVPLVANRAIAFVENKKDRKLLERFAVKAWGEKKQRRIWEKISFLYTYQDPIAAGVLDLARQVKDLLKTTGVVPTPTRFVAVGDRDYRSDASRKKAMREIAQKSKSAAYKLDLKVKLWEHNEIENLLLDKEAILTALDNQETKVGTGSWPDKRQDFEAELERLISSQRDDVRQRFASRIQQENRNLDLTTAVRKADEFLDKHWGDGTRWCDAKKVVSGLRTWLQNHDLNLRIVDAEIVEAMQEVPAEVKSVLRLLSGLAAQRRSRARGSKS